jgi:hypothetical protein
VSGFIGTSHFAIHAVLLGVSARPTFDASSRSAETAELMIHQTGARTRSLRQRTTTVAPAQDHDAGALWWQLAARLACRRRSASSASPVALFLSSSFRFAWTLGLRSHCWTTHYHLKPLFHEQDD